MQILINITSCGTLVGQALSKTAFAVTPLEYLVVKECTLPNLISTTHRLAQAPSVLGQLKSTFCIGLPFRRNDVGSASHFSTHSPVVDMTRLRSSKARLGSTLPRTSFLLALLCMQCNAVRKRTWSKIHHKASLRAAIGNSSRWE